jgi:hypothetical protein
MNRHLFYTDGNSLLSLNRISLVAFRDEVRALKIKAPQIMDIRMHGKCFVMTGVRNLISNIKQCYNYNAVFSLMIEVSQKEFQSIKATARMIPTEEPTKPMGGKQHAYFKDEDDYGIITVGGIRHTINEPRQFSRKAIKTFPLIWDSEDTVGNYKPTI